MGGGLATRAARAARLLGWSDAVYDRLGARLSPGMFAHHDVARKKTSRALGAERSKAEWLAGGGMTPEQIVRLARRQTAPSGLDHADGTQLTPRELEVAELVARGATNQQISVELLIALETVKTHVRSTLRKLGFESRVQIAAWYAQRREHES